MQFFHVSVGVETLSDPIPESVRVSAAYFGKFVQSSLPKLESIYISTKAAQENDWRSDVDKSVHQLAGSFYGFLSTTFSNVDFPSGFVTPEKFKSDVLFFRSWLTDNVKPRIIKQNSEAVHYSIYASELLKFMDNYVDITDYVLGHFPETLVITDPSAIFEQMASGFTELHARLQKRREDRPTITINDEYDVQDLYCSALKLFVANIKLEENTASVGGKKPRADAFLPDFSAFVDFKKTNTHLTDKGISAQLLEDCHTYKRDMRCKYIYFFVYDQGYLLKNAAGIKADIESDEVTRDGTPIVVKCHIVR